MITFIRIPKNASTSLYTFFGDKNTIRNELIDADNKRYLNVFESSHCEIDYAVDKLGEEILNKPVLAVVRNPFDRLVSMFFFARKYNLGSLYGINTESFDKFAVDFHSHSKDKDFFHAIPQCDYIKHDKDIDITVIRFENLQDDLRRFIEEKKLEFDINNLEKLNSTEHDHYSGYYSGLSKSVVVNMWKDDLIKFSYSFDETN